MLDKNLIRLSNAETVIDVLNNDIYIDYNILNLRLEEVFEISKILLSFFQKTIIFRFNGHYFEVKEETTIEQVKTLYQYYEHIRHITYVNKVFQNATGRLSESNVKSTIDEMYKELVLNKKECIYRPYIRLYDQKQFSSKLYKIYRQNHKSERIELLAPLLEIPKVMVKK